MRRVIAFPCEGETLIGTLDDAPGATGLLIVSGGNEIRCGAHRGMALLAQHVAAQGFPVFRYDRRGIGDSTGENNGFLSTRADIHAAALAFRAHAPQFHMLIAYANCDAASALAFYGRNAGIDRVLLANPWTIDDTDDLPPAAAIRAIYRHRLTSPAAWRDLLTGKINLSKAAAGARKAASPASRLLADRVVQAVKAWSDDVTVILASGDATAHAYRAVAGQIPAEVIESHSHSFARPHDQSALKTIIMTLLRAV